MTAAMGRFDHLLIRDSDSDSSETWSHARNAAAASRSGSAAPPQADAGSVALLTDIPSFSGVKADSALVPSVPPEELFDHRRHSPTERSQAGHSDGAPSVRSPHSRTSGASLDANAATTAGPAVVSGAPSVAGSSDDNFARSSAQTSLRSLPASIGHGSTRSGGLPARRASQALPPRKVLTPTDRPIVAALPLSIAKEEENTVLVSAPDASIPIPDEQHTEPRHHRAILARTLTGSSSDGFHITRSGLAPRSRGTPHSSAEAQLPPPAHSAGPATAASSVRSATPLVAPTPLAVVANSMTSSAYPYEDRHIILVSEASDPVASGPPLSATESRHSMATLSDHRVLLADERPESEVAPASLAGPPPPMTSTASLKLSPFRASVPSSAASQGTTGSSASAHHDRLYPVEEPRAAVAGDAVEEPAVLFSATAASQHGESAPAAKLGKAKVSCGLFFCKKKKMESSEAGSRDGYSSNQSAHAASEVAQRAMAPAVASSGSVAPAEASAASSVPASSIGEARASRTPASSRPVSTSAVPSQAADARPASEVAEQSPWAAASDSVPAVGDDEEQPPTPSAAVAAAVAAVDAGSAKSDSVASRGAESRDAGEPAKKRKRTRVRKPRQAEDDKARRGDDSPVQSQASSRHAAADRPRALLAERGRTPTSNDVSFPVPSPTAQHPFEERNSSTAIVCTARNSSTLDESYPSRRSSSHRTRSSRHDAECSPSVPDSDRRPCEQAARDATFPEMCDGAGLSSETYDLLTHDKQRITPICSEPHGEPNNSRGNYEPHSVVAEEEEDLSHLQPYQRRMLLDLRQEQRRENEKLAKEWQELTFRPVIHSSPQFAVQNSSHYSDRLSRSRQNSPGARSIGSGEAAVAPWPPHTGRTRRSTYTGEPVPSFAPVISAYAQSRPAPPGTVFDRLLATPKTKPPPSPTAAEKECRFAPVISERARSMGANRNVFERLTRLPGRGAAGDGQAMWTEADAVDETRRSSAAVLPRRRENTPNGESVHDRLYNQHRTPTTSPHGSPDRHRSPGRYEHSPQITRMARRMSAENPEGKRQFYDRMHRGGHHQPADDGQPPLPAEGLSRPTQRQSDQKHRTPFYPSTAVSSVGGDDHPVAMSTHSNPAAHNDDNRDAFLSGYYGSQSQHSSAFSNRSVSSHPNQGQDSDKNVEPLCVNS